MRRVFVVGCPRSGTTLVQSLLAAHPALTGFTESHFFDKAFKPGLFGGWRINQNELSKRLETFLRENDAEGSAEDALGLIDLCDEVAAKRGASGWVEKTPDHVFRLKLIKSVSSDALVVHVVRRGQGVLPSLRKASETAGWADVKPWWECALHWLWALRRSNKYVGGARHVFVSYDKLVADPPGQAKRLIEAMCLPWDDAVLDNYGQAAAALISDGEDWKANAKSEIERKNQSAVVKLPLVGRLATMWSKRYRKLWRAVDQD